MLLFPQLLHDTKSIFCQQVQILFFLSPEVSSNKHGMDRRGACPPNISSEETLLLSPNICMTQSQSSVIKFSYFVFSYNLKSVITNLGGWSE